MFKIVSIHFEICMSHIWNSQFPRCFLLLVKTVLLLGAFLLLAYSSLIYIVDYIRSTNYM